MEFVWRPMHSTLGDSAQIFAHALFDSTKSPPSLNFESIDFTPIVTNKSANNLNYRAK